MGIISSHFVIVNTFCEIFLDNVSQFVYYFRKGVIFMLKNQLKKLREGKDISQAKLAKDLGVAASTIGMYESGKREPDYEMLERLPIIST